MDMDLGYDESFQVIRKARSLQHVIDSIPLQQAAVAQVEHSRSVVERSARIDISPRSRFLLSITRLYLYSLYYNIGANHVEINCAELT